MMTNARYEAELKVLQEKLPSNVYRFFNMDTSMPYARMAIRTNSGQVFTIQVNLGCFPELTPPVFVVGKPLEDKFHRLLISAKAKDHTLSCDHLYGWTRPCLFNAASWNATISIFRVYIKAKVWLEGYEASLRSGRHIDYYLSHSI